MSRTWAHLLPIYLGHTFVIAVLAVLLESLRTDVSGWTRLAPPLLTVLSILVSLGVGHATRRVDAWLD